MLIGDPGLCVVCQGRKYQGSTPAHGPCDHCGGTGRESGLSKRDEIFLTRIETRIESALMTGAGSMDNKQEQAKGE